MEKDQDALHINHYLITNTAQHFPTWSFLPVRPEFTEIKYIMDIGQVYTGWQK